MANWLRIVDYTRSQTGFSVEVDQYYGREPRQQQLKVTQLSDEDSITVTVSQLGRIAYIEPKQKFVTTELGSSYIELQGYCNSVGIHAIDSSYGFQPLVSDTYYVVVDETDDPQVEETCTFDESITGDPGADDKYLFKIRLQCPAETFDWQWIDVATIDGGKTRFYVKQVASR